MMDEGTYYGTLIACGTGKSKKNNIPQVWLEFDIGQMATPEQDWKTIESAKRMVYMSLSEKAESYTIANLESMGWNGKFGDEMSFTDKQAMLKCEHNLYDGKNRERWGFPQKESPKPDALDANTIRTLNAKYAAKKRAAGQSTSPTPPPAANDGPPPPSDEEVEPAGAGSTTG